MTETTPKVSEPHILQNTNALTTGPTVSDVVDPTPPGRSADRNMTQHHQTSHTIEWHSRIARSKHRRIAPVESPGLPGKCRTCICSAVALPVPTPHIRELTFQTNTNAHPIERNTSLSTLTPLNNPNTTTNTSETGRISVYYQNVRGLRTKIETFSSSVLDDEYDVIVLTETWLNDEITSQQLFGQQYSVYRKDRCPLASGKKLGGGVLIAVSKRWISQAVNCSIDPNIEHLWVKISLLNLHIFIGVAYISPDFACSESIINQHFDSVTDVTSSMGPHDMHLLFGDYNQPTLHWVARDDGLCFPDSALSSFTASSTLLTDRVSLLDLRQLNSVKNMYGRTLDLILANRLASHNCATNGAMESLVPIDRHHPALMTTIDCPATTPFYEPTPATRLNFKRADFSALNAALCNVDWSILREITSVNDAVTLFTSTVTALFESTVPIQRTPRKPPWSNNELRRLKRIRAQTLRHYTHRKNLITKSAFTSASNTYRRYNRGLYRRYVENTQNNLKRNPKQFWNYINSKRKENGLPKRMFLEDETSDSPQEQCDLFARHFASVFSSEIISPDHLEKAMRHVPENAMHVPLPSYTEEQILLAIKKLKASYSPGPDGIPPIILKKCASSLCKPLAIIFTLSLVTSTFPEAWKRSVMLPTFKKGDKQNIQNYRGVTSLCAGSKLLEILVSQSLLHSARSYLSFDQHGFIPCRSISTNLTEFTSFCLRAIEDGHQVDTVYTDLKAAFDRVNHQLLLSKLSRLGVAEPLVKWFESYLVGRKLSVNLGSLKSSDFPNHSGVPQGSNLGPLLFSIFFNDVTLILPESCRKVYADDLKIYERVSTIEDCFRLQGYIDLFSNWCSVNRLSISISKCAVISFTRKLQPFQRMYHISGTPLERVSVIKDLGVLLDEKLTFIDHYTAIISKANKNLGFIMRVAREFRDPYCLRSLYFSLVRSLLETASVVWCPFATYWSDRIESIQARFVKYALRLLPWSQPQELTSYKDRCRLLDMNTLLERRLIARTIFMKKLIDAEIDSPRLLQQVNFNIRPRTLRNHETLRLNFQRTNYGQHEPIRMMCKTFNHFFELYDFGLSADVFKTRIRNSPELNNLIALFNTHLF